MRESILAGSIVSAGLAAAILTGCAAPASSVPIASVPSSSASGARIPSLRTLRLRFANSAASRAPAFANVAAVNAPHGNRTVVSDVATETVSVWNEKGQLTALLYTYQSAPAGLATDAAESIYAVDSTDSAVLVYPKPYASIGLVLSDPHSSPNGVAVSSGGIVAVTSIFDPISHAAGSVSIYAKGATSPCVTLSDPNWSEMAWDAFNRAGDLLVTGINADHTKALVGEISGGCSAKSIRLLRVGNILQSAGDIQVYNGKVLILDSAGLTVYTYAPARGSLGMPIARTVLPRAMVPVSFVMDAGGRQLWMADYFRWAVLEYQYPSGSLLTQLNDNIRGAWGVAVNPVAPS
jgi:hypothetical protein